MNMTKSRDYRYLGNAPLELVEYSKKRVINRIAESQKKLKNETRKTVFKYYVSLCLIIRDENEYLEEWLDWHDKQGVEHFYIYDHGSKNPVLNFLSEHCHEFLKKVTVINWSGRHKDAQPDAYNDCLKRARCESRWVGFVDTDEQINVKTGQTLPEFLKDYEDCANLFAMWVVYGANGHISQTNERLRERFTEVSHGDEWAEKVGKSIVQPIYMREMVIHNGRTEEGFIIVDEHKNKLDDYVLMNETPTRDLICVDHFYTKSYEEWLNKLRRGSSHAKFSRRYEEFFQINPSMEFCRENIKIKQEYEKF